MWWEFFVNFGFGIPRILSVFAAMNSSPLTLVSNRIFSPIILHCKCDVGNVLWNPNGRPHDPRAQPSRHEALPMAHLPLRLPLPNNFINRYRLHWFNMYLSYSFEIKNLFNSVSFFSLHWDLVLDRSPTREAPPGPHVGLPSSSWHYFRGIRIRNCYFLR